MIRFSTKLCLAVAVCTLLATFAAAIDTSGLKPPKGAKIAIVAFEDLQCPDCADAEPILEAAVAKYNIPLVRKDFPLPMHVWAFEAHVLARFFGTISPQLNEEWWRYVYANQPSINKANLRGFAERFADQHGRTLPDKVDPDGKLAAAVMDDFHTAQRAGVDHTPTVFVVSVDKITQPMVETFDRDTLFAMIEKLQSEAASK
ncbi:MAG TPA: thioredoxin domain-containing protein [Terriglobales bacterium]